MPSPSLGMFVADLQGLLLSSDCFPAVKGGCLNKHAPSDGCCFQVLRHEWVTDSGRLPAVQHYSDSSIQLMGDSDVHATEQAQVLTALKRQVSPAEKRASLGMLIAGADTARYGSNLPTPKCKPM